MPYRREHAESFVGEVAAGTWQTGGALFAVDVDGVVAGAMTLFPPRDGVGAEGVLRQRSLHRGMPVDDVIYGLLASDPRPDA